MKKGLIVVTNSDDTWFTLEEVCNICRISPEFIDDLIEYEIINPHQLKLKPVFNVNHLQRIKATLRLQRDLELNLPGIAIVLDLLDEIEDLRKHIELLEKHF